MINANFRFGARSVNRYCKSCDINGSQSLELQPEPLRHLVFLNSKVRKFSQKVLRLVVHKPLTYSVFINNRPGKRVVQSSRDVQYRTETIEHSGLPQLECELN